MIKYAVLTPSLAQPGGAERTILIQVRYADPDRMKCTGIALSGFGGLDEHMGRELLRYAEIHGDMPRGRWQRPRMPMVKTVYRNLNEAVRHVARDAQVLVTWGALAMATHTEGLEIPVVCVSHSASAADAQISGITHLVAVSETARQYFEAARGDSDWPPVAVIPNGVEVERICPRRGRAWQRAEWGVAADDKVLLYLGRQALDKNPWGAVKALGQLPEDYKLVMIGNQSFRPDRPMPRLVDLVVKLGLGGRVKFYPPISFVGDALAGADCLIHLSFQEADSLVVKEAFMAGLPVVHTPVGAIPEMEAEFGPVGWGVALRHAEVPLEAKPSELGPGAFGKTPKPPAPLVIDPEEAAAQVRRAIAGDSAAIVNKMRAVAWDRWTGPAMCERWADYLEEVVASWE